MKNKLEPLIFTLILSFMSSSYAQDDSTNSFSPESFSKQQALGDVDHKRLEPTCILTEKIDELALVDCSTPLKKTQLTLYSQDGDPFYIQKNIVDAKYLVKREASSNSSWSKILGEELTTEAPQSFYIQRHNKKAFEIDLYFSLFSYNQTDFETDGDNDQGIAKIKIGEDEFKTLPFEFTADFIFESAVLSISPRVSEDFAGGNISIYHRNNTVWFGGFLDYQEASSKRSRELNNSVSSVEDSKRDLRFGLTLRRNFSINLWQSYLKFKVGYLVESEESTDANSVKSTTELDALFGEVYFKSHTEITNNLFLGFGLGAFYGSGNFDFESQNINFVDNLDGFGFEVLPFSILVSY